MKLTPKQFTINTIKFGNKKRIQEVLKRYWKHRKKVDSEVVTPTFAQKLFNE